MSTSTIATFRTRTRSKAPFALVKVTYGPQSVEQALAGIKPRPQSIKVLGYAHSTGPRVEARAKRLGARIVPIVRGWVEV
jgi:hypothetical protein